ncbi:integrase, partial [Paraburkholderia sp. RL18-103-BIB-C]
MTTALPAPRPLDALDLSPDLDGRHGTNRVDGRRQVAADTDVDALRAWLARFAETKTTFDNYRKEAERL